MQWKQQKASWFNAHCSEWLGNLEKVIGEKLYFAFSLTY